MSPGSTRALLDRGARERMQRLLLLAVGVGALVFGALLAPGTSGFLSQTEQLTRPFGVIALVIGLVMPISFIVLHRVLPLRALLVYAGTSSLGFVAVEAAWPLLQPEPTLIDNAPPWIQGITAVHATTAAIVWPRLIGWIYPILQGVLVALTAVQVRDDALHVAMLDAVGAVVFCLILAGVSIAMVRAGDKQDAAAAHAREQAALEASRATKEAERARINAIVHDDVMSVLLAAGRASAPEELVAQARHALESVDSLASGRLEERAYDPHELVAVVRATVTRLSPESPVSFGVQDDSPVPAPVVAAFAEATGEAVRNAVLHADAVPRVGIDVEEDGVTVVVADDGAGFTLSRVAPRRLGLQVSIVGRMRSLEGGHAAVASAPGRGTTVTLVWRRP